MTDGVTIECLSCNQRSEADSPRDADREGDWRCPFCRSRVGSVATGEKGTGP